MDEECNLANKLKLQEICTQPLDLFNVAISKFVVRPSSLYASSLSWIQAKEVGGLL